MDNSPKNLLAETVSVLIAALILTLVILHVNTPAVAGHRDVLIAALWLYLPVMAILIRKSGFAEMGVENLDWGRSLLWFLIASAIIFPLFYLGAYFGAANLLHYRFRLEMPPLLGNMLLGQLLLTALPEEWFFRGYLQGRLDRVFGRNWKLFSAQTGPALFIVAAVFALAHFLVRPSPDRLLVFFPALAFGWLREKTDSLVAPVLFHAASNLTFLIFQAGIVR